MVLLSTFTVIDIFDMIFSLSLCLCGGIFTSTNTSECVRSLLVASYVYQHLYSARGSQ